MADPWYTEIGLQKVYSLSPSEAYCVVCRHNGYSISAVAEVMGISESTARTLFRRGVAKMKKKGKTVSLVILKGNKDVEGTMIKQNAIKVLAAFVSKLYGSEAVFAKYTIVVGGIPSEPLGDPLKMNETLFRKVDLYGTTNDEQAEARAEKLMQAFNELNLDKNDFGLAVLRYLLDKMYVQYDVIE